MPLDPTVEQLLSTLTLRQKLGQLLIVYFEGPTLSSDLRRMIEDFHIGGVILYSVAGNILSPHQVAKLNQDIQHTALRKPESKIPLWISIDQEGYPVERLTQGVTRFPSQMALGATGSVALARQMGVVMATELKALGINLNFTPVLDVNNNPANPVIGIRAFGSQPEQVLSFGLAVLEGYQQVGVMTTAKHFPGHGDTPIDSHLGLPRLEFSRERLDQVELVPFRAAIKAKVPAIMTAHMQVPSLDPQDPITLSFPALQTLLRQELGFQGVIISDSLTMGALNHDQGLAVTAEKALLAGVDILLLGADEGHSPDEQIPVYNHLIQRVEAGDIPLAVIDQAVARILQAKAEYGLLDPVPFERPICLDPIGLPSHLELAAGIARASITQVNSNGLLPLQGDELILWPASRHTLGFRLQQIFPSMQLFPVGLDPHPSDWDRLHQAAQNVRAIVVAVHDMFRHPHQAQWIQALPPDRVILVATGSPFDVLEFPSVATRLVCYGDSEVSLSALVEVLSGKVTPTGHFPTLKPWEPKKGG